MAKRFLITVLVVAGLAPVATSAAARPFTAHADLLTSGCNQTLAANVVRVTGCTADAPARGAAAPGRLRIAYSAELQIARGVGTQQGTLTLASASGKDVLVARFGGTVSIAGVGRGTWTAVRRRGAYAALAARGSYSSRTPDRGVHVSFDVRG
jgi:hypothetical protein